MNKKEKAQYASWIMLLLLSACQASDELAQEQEYTVSIMARIGKSVPEGRYVQTNDKTPALFAPNDDIGIFMDDATVVRWVFNETAWASEETVYWADKDKKHTFCAYYPYSGSQADEGKDKVQMPSLEGQTGNWDNIAQYDFLVTSKELSYNDNAGNVSFTDDNAFRHVSSLMKINIKSENDMGNATIDKITFKGNDLITQAYYSFTTDAVTVDGTSQESLSVTPNHPMNGKDASFYFILNGTPANESGNQKGANPIDFTIEYTSNNKKYTAHREALCNGIISGRIHEYNILVKGGLVIITGGGISGWTPGNTIEDIIINGEEDSQN